MRVAWLPVLVVLGVLTAASTRASAQQPPPGAVEGAPPAGNGDGNAPAPGDPGDDEGEPAADDDGTTTRVGCIDDLSVDGYQRKGVQKRDFTKRLKFEIYGVGGFYASDLLSSTYTAGGGFAFFPSEDFGLEVLVNWAPVRFRLEQPFSEFDRSRRFTSGSALQALGGLLFSPFHAKFKVTEQTIVHGDLFAVVGGGRTFHDSVQGLTFQGGLGLRLYLMRRLSFRLDVRDFILPQEVLGRGRTTHNLTLLAGFGIWLG
jgi:outer membrane beta-barrel protein